MSARIPELYAPAADVAPWRREARERRYHRAVVRALLLLLSEERYRDALALARAADLANAASHGPDYEYGSELAHHLLVLSGAEAHAIYDLFVAAQARLDVASRARCAALMREMDREEATDASN